MKYHNIYYRKDGRWEGRIYTGKAEDGRRKYKAFFGKTREEAEKKMSAYAAKTEQKVNPPVVFSNLFFEWLKSARIRVKESTAANYTMKAKKHILPVFGDRMISDISPKAIYEFIERKQREKLSNRYIADILVLMKSVFKFAVKTYQCSNPMDGIALPKKRQPEIRLLDTAQQRQLWKYIYVNQNPTTLGIAISLSMGLRIGELCALQWSDIDMEKRILTVRKTIQRIQTRGEDKKTKLVTTEPKSESSKRTMPIPEDLYSLLSKFQKHGDIYLLSGSKKPVEPRTMQYRFSSILKNVKLPSIHYHALRHMFATNCIRLGFDVKALSELLGHSTVEITLNRYVHSSFEQKIEYMNRIKLVS